MVKRIAVVGPGSTWRRGVAAVLQDAGFATVDLETLSAWRPGRGGSALAVRAPDPEALTDIGAFVGEHPHIPVVTVVPFLGVTEYASAVLAGATAAIAEEETIHGYTLTFNAALDGRSSIPAIVLRALAARLPPSLDDVQLADAERGYLRALAAGATVAELADEAGYSEREMFRMLKDVYAVLGVDNRTEAIIWATRHGVLDV